MKLNANLPLFCLFLLSSLFIYSVSYSQKIGFTQYSLEQGLSEAEVRQVIQTKDGFMWVATRYGLNRFDGNTFDTYYTEDGLVDNKIHSLFEDQHQTLWIGTANGISAYKEGLFYTPAGLRILEGTIIESLFEDVQGHIWIGTDGMGAYKWNPDTKELINFTTETGLSNDRVRDILQTKDGVIWLGTRNGLNGYLNDTFRHYFESDGLADNKIRALAISVTNELLIGTRGGLSVFKNGLFINYGPENGLYSQKITSIGVGTNGITWLATEDGITSMIGDSFRIYNLLDGLPVNIYQSVWIDKHNQAWFGSFGSGLIKMIGDQVLRYDSEFPFPERVIRSIAVKDQRNLWLGTYGGGLVKLGKDNSVRTYRMSNGLTDDKVYSLYADNDDLWIGTQGGLDLLTNDRIINFFPDILPFRKIRDIAKNENSLWLATYGDGLINFDIKSQTYEQLTVNSHNLPNNTLEQVLIDQQKNIWIGTYSGIAKISSDLTKTTTYTIEDGLPNNAVTNISEDRSNNIWASTYKGIVRINGDEVLAFDEFSGLPGGLCFFIIQDKWDDALFWIGTNVGLVRFDINAFFAGNDAFMIYDEMDGLLRGEFNEGAAAWYNDRLTIGTVNGMMSIDTREFIPETLPPSILLTSTQVVGVPIDSLSRLSLSHDQNFLTFDYNGFDFISPAKISYEYRLTPIEKGFNKTNENRVRYSALPPGDYWFEVQAINNSGLKTPVPERLHFVIHPPFWQQWWFLTILMILVAGVIVFIYNYFRINRLVDIERMRVRIASDLHDDVGATLTEIALNTDFLMATNASKDMEQPLFEIGGLARNVVSSLDDIVWSIDARNDTAGDLGDRIQDTASHVFRNQKTKLHYEFDSSNTAKTLPVEVRENVFLIVKEALNNASKYANASNIWVQIAFSKGQLEVRIKDDGIGINNHINERKGNGMLNMKMRAQRIAAILDIKSNNGTTIRLSNIRV